MSQRLLICLSENIKDEDGFYDCIYTEKSGLMDLLFDWLSCKPGLNMYFGPWRITIRDSDIMDQFLGDFKKIKEFCPAFQSLADCWSIYDEKLDKVIHVNEEEGKKWDQIVSSILKNKD